MIVNSVNATRNSVCSSSALLGTMPVKSFNALVACVYDVSGAVDIVWVSHCSRRDSDPIGITSVPTSSSSFVSQKNLNLRYLARNAEAMQIFSSSQRRRDRFK